MKILRYYIHLLEPTLVTALDGDPNSAVAYDFLPGSALRGACIQRYLRQHTQGKFIPMDGGCGQQLFFSPKVRFLNAYLIDETGNRSLPVALDWQKVKDHDEYAYVGSNFEKWDDQKQVAKNATKEEDPQFKGLGDGSFCIAPKSGSDGFWLLKPDRYIAVHTQRQRKFGRSLREDGAIYRYESLAADQVFMGLVLFDDDVADEDIELLQSLLQGDTQLGGSRSAGYGQARFYNEINADSLCRYDDDNDRWREIWLNKRYSGPNDLNDIQSGTTFTITLLSDALLRDENGQPSYSPDCVKQAVSQCLGCSVESLEVVRSFVRGTYVGGFDRKWGLPLNQYLATQMGSTLKLKTTQDCSAEQLLKLEQQGIGERRNEGFGRVTVNWLSEQTYLIIKPSTKAEKHPASGKQHLAEPKNMPADGTNILLNDPQRMLVQRMLENIAKTRLETVLIEQINKVEVQNPPAAAQLSRLREVLREMLVHLSPETDRSKNRLTEFLSELASHRGKLGSYERAKIAGTEKETSLLTWINTQLTNANPTIKKTLAELPDLNRVQLPGDLQYEYTLRLIDGVLARSLKIEAAKQKVLQDETNKIDGGAKRS